MNSSLTSPTNAPMPACAGIGAKPVHYSDLLAQTGRVGWIEVHAENFMGAGGPAHRWLTRLRETYPLSVHGVGLSLGSPGGLDEVHLQRLAKLVERYQPELVSEHLSFSSAAGIYMNDLCPVPLNDQTLGIFSEHVDQMQEALGRRVLIENPSTYLVPYETTWSEPEFLNELARRTGCGLLLDINNVYVSAHNHDFDPHDYLQKVNLRAVGEIHLAGHAIDRRSDATLLVDDHGDHVCDDVWHFYEATMERSGPLPTLIEWDTRVPSFEILADEAAKADVILNKVGQGETLGSAHG